MARRKKVSFSEDSKYIVAYCIVQTMEYEKKDFIGLTDEILFQQYLRGNVDAFDEILRRTKGLVYSLILRYIKDKPVADEIFQDVFLKVCKNRELFRESVSFKSWLATVCRNTCIDHIRQQSRTLKTQPLQTPHDDERMNVIDFIPSSEPTPDGLLSEHLENTELEALIAKLPAEQSETFYLKIIMEMTFEEIGEAMQCSTNTAKSRYRYALDTLRGIIKRKRLLQKAVGT